MKYSEFLKAVQTKQISPVTTFLGEETFLKDRALEAVLNRFLDEESRQFNFRMLAGDELKDSSFLDEASTVAMFGDWKILYLKDAGIIDKALGRIKEYLESYLSSPAPETLMIFDVNSWEGKSKLKAILTKKTTVVEFNPLSEKEIPSWITGHLRTLNFQISSAAVQLISERLGTNLQKISSELEKLMLLRHSERKISQEDVESTVGYSPTGNLWQWSEAILDQDAPKAIKLLGDLLEKEEEPVLCVGLLAKQFEKMILTKEMVQQKVPQAAISSKINKPLYFLPQFLNQLSRFSMSDLIKGMQVLSYTDRALKSSQASPETTLQLMTLQLCGLKSPAPPIFDVPLNL
ncbi:MAG: DNA polymerase III subunit delta [Acidobacteria bacterium]|nr:MAG: DNA polymerase III subunit delta [Acidobacteriota bacterium]